MYLFTHVSARKSDVTGTSELKKTSAKLRQLEDVNAKLKAKGFFFFQVFIVAQCAQLQQENKSALLFCIPTSTNDSSPFFVSVKELTGLLDDSHAEKIELSRYIAHINLRLALSSPKIRCEIVSNTHLKLFYLLYGYVRTYLVQASSSFKIGTTTEK